jgi:hypothetical protein
LGALAAALAAALFGEVQVVAQTANSTFTMHQETASAGGGLTGTPQTSQVRSSVGLPTAGETSNAEFRLNGGMTVAASPELTAPVTVTGTVDDLSGAVTVNGTAAVVDPAAMTYSAQLRLPIGHSTITTVATDAVNNTASTSVTVCIDLPPSKKLPLFSITVRGAVDDVSSAVSVNGAAAVIEPSTGQYSALVPLTGGMNTVTATATDPVGNSASSSIQVFVPVAPPPARPAVGMLPTLASQNTITVSGTKTRGTSIWINGQLVVPLGDATSWSVAITLAEGDNELIIVAKNASGATSAEVRRNVVLDNAPTAITVPQPLKTNFTPFILTGTVEDSLTEVEVVIGALRVTAARTGRTFAADIPLILGANTVRIEAVSPNGHPSNRTIDVTRGTIPSIQTWQPPTGTIWQVGVPYIVAVTATDAQGDSIIFEIAVDGAALSGSEDGDIVLAPDLDDRGARVLSLRAWDGYGGADQEDVDVFVVRQPVQHP